MCDHSGGAGSTVVPQATELCGILHEIIFFHCWFLSVWISHGCFLCISTLLSGLTLPLWSLGPLSPVTMGT